MRRPTLRRLFLAGLAIIAIACSPGSAASPDPSDVPGPAGTSLGWYDELTDGTDKLDVATTVAPISSLARNIGGDRIRLHGIVPDATNSHTFEPSPRMRDISPPRT
jgi:ABC-type Zn uptake system ZnuABC Zn-binding protein ZnuA